MKRVVPLVFALAACTTPVAAPGPLAEVSPPVPAAAPTEPAPSPRPSTTAKSPPAATSPSPPPRVPTSARAAPATSWGSAQQLAAQLVVAEDAIRRLPPAQLAPHAHAQQAAYRQLAAQPELVDAVLAAVPARLQHAVRTNLHAAIQLHALVRPAKQLPAWAIVPPAPGDELLAYYREAEVTAGVPWPYLAAIHLVETRMGRIRGTSSAGAQGPMQFMPATWAAYGRGDVHDNRDAILAAARYLQTHGAPTDMDRALYAYNHSRRYVEAVRAYAEVMLADARAYAGYYHWQVYYRMTSADMMLPEGWVGSGS